MSRTLSFFLFAVTLVASSAATSKTEAATIKHQPNIVLVMADDLGNADLGYRGSKIKTPHLDKLANTGVRLESYYGQQL